MARVNIFLDPELLKSLDREARQANLSRSGFVQNALRDYIERSRKAREEEERRRQKVQASERIDRLAERLGAWDPVKAVREGRERRSRVRK